MPADAYHLSNVPEGAAGTAATVAAMAALAAGPYGAHAPAIRDLAVQLVGQVDSYDYAGEARAILAGWMRRVRYRKDPAGLERVQTAAITWRERAGDCDDQAVGLASLLGSLGHRCRFVTGGLPDAWSHVWVQVWIGGRWLDLDACRREGPRLGWHASFLTITPWPENTPDGFDARAALSTRSMSTTMNSVGLYRLRPPSVLSGLGHLSGSAIDPATITKDALGPLPSPADWYRDHPNGPFFGDTVPGWAQATTAQRGPFSKALLWLSKQTGEELQRTLDAWDTAYRVTVGVATLGASEVLRAWESLVADANKYRDIRTAKLKEIAAAVAAKRTKYADALRAALARGDAAIREKMSILAPFLASEAGLGFLPNVILGLSAPVALALIAAVAAAIAFALKEVAAVVDSVSEAFGGAPFLLIAAVGAGGWWWLKHGSKAKRARA